MLSTNHDMAVKAWASRCGGPGLGDSGQSRSGGLRRGKSRFGQVGQSSPGESWCGTAWCFRSRQSGSVGVCLGGSASLVAAWQSSHGSVRRVASGHGEVGSQGESGHVAAGFGKAWFGCAGQGSRGVDCPVWARLAWCGQAVAVRHGMVRLGGSGRVVARQSGRGLSRAARHGRRVVAATVCSVPVRCGSEGLAWQSGQVPSWCGREWRGGQGRIRQGGAVVARYR